MAREQLTVCSLLFVVILAFTCTHADMHQRRPMMMQQGPSRVVHVHHYDAGSSGKSNYGGHMSSNYVKSGYGKGHGGHGGSSLLDLIILSSLFNNNNNGGLLGLNNGLGGLGVNGLGVNGLGVGGLGVNGLGVGGLGVGGVGGVNNLGLVG